MTVNYNAALAGAICHACATGVPALATGDGPLGLPYGACLNCHAFACGHHGRRQAQYPRIRCCECDPNLLGASAAATAGAARSDSSALAPEQPGLPGSAERARRELLSGWRESFLPWWYWAIPDVDAFHADRPSYPRQLFARVRDLGAPRSLTGIEDPLVALWEWLSPEGRDLLRLAAIIVAYHDRPDEQLSPVMSRLRAAFIG